MMDSTDLFTSALGFSSPWRVDDIRFDPEQREIHFDVICGEKRLPCQVCGETNQPIHDRKTCTWQHQLLHQSIVEAEVGVHLLQAAIFFLQLLQPLQVRCFHSAVLGSSLVKQSCADSQITIDLFNGDSRFRLLDCLDDRLFTVLTFFSCLSPVWRGSCHFVFMLCLILGEADTISCRRRSSTTEATCFNRPS